MNTSPFTLIDSADEWDRFVASVPGDTISQTSGWGSTKASRFEAQTFGIRRDGEIVAGCLLLVGKVGPIPVSYAPRGPLVAPGHEALAGELVAGLSAQLGRWRPAVIMVQPAWEPPELTSALANAGFGLAAMDVSTPATVEIALDDDVDDLFKRLRSSRRRNIRKGEKFGLKVRRGDVEDLPTFFELHRNTAIRQSFEPMSLSYLERQWEVLGKGGSLSVYLAESDGEALSAATTTSFGDRVVFKLAGLSADQRARDSRASDFLHWEIMVDAKRRGFRYYDLGGFDKEAAAIIAAGGEPPEHIRESASQFKLGFGGDVRVLPEARWKFSPSIVGALQNPIMASFDRWPAVQNAAATLRD